MVELDGDFRAVLMDGGDDARQAVPLAVVPEAEIASGDAAAVLDAGGFLDDETDAADGAGGVMDVMPVGGEADAAGDVVAHRWHDDAVFQGQSLGGERGEQHCGCLPRVWYLFQYFRTEGFYSCFRLTPRGKTSIMDLPKWICRGGDIAWRRRSIP